MNKYVLLLSISAIACAAFDARAAEAVTDEPIKFDIPAQSLDTALLSYSRQSGVQVITNSNSLGSAQAPALHAVETPKEALTSLLKGSNLKFVFTSATTAAIVSNAASKVNHLQPVALATRAARDAAEPATSADATSSETVVVTGSRIPRVQTTTANPVGIVSAEKIEQRAFTNAAQALNDLPQFQGSVGAVSGTVSRGATSGREFVDLFNLGTQRTLTLVNGRRFIGSAPAGGGSGGTQVDMNNIPLGLVDHVETVQGSGAAVYGSDAIAGVVNVILKKNFEGLNLYSQGGVSEHGDYPRELLRATAGTNLLDGRANIAINVEWAKTGSLLPTDRSYTGRDYSFVRNPANVSNTDGIPATILKTGWRFPEGNANGVIFQTNSPTLSSYLRVNGSPVQFAPGGQVVPYNLGTYYGIGSAVGGQGIDFASFYTLLDATERVNATVLGNLDLTPHIRVTTELLASGLNAREPVTQYPINLIFSSPPSNAVALHLSNPYLQPSAQAALAGAGVTDLFYLSRTNTDLIDPSLTSNSHTYRGLIGVDGDFSWEERKFYWNAAFSEGRNYGTLTSYDVNRQGFLYAADAVASGSNIACRVTVNNPSSTDPLIKGCVPVNLFGQGAPSQAARNYLGLQMVTRYANTQTDVEANFGGNLLDLPAGPVGFNTGFEYRREASEYNPNQAVQLGLGRAAGVPPVTGSYDTKELYGEGIVPLLGDRFTLPLVNMAEVTGSFRWVNNSLAGQNNAWSYGGRVGVLDDLTLRATRSNTFRAPSLYELFLPRSTALQAPVVDPCDKSNINAGNVPSVRQANCQAAFTALGLPANYQLDSSQTIFRQVLTGGNQSLKNETADSLTAGFVYTPNFVPGLTLTADWIKINVKNAITNFNLQATLQACYDNATKSPYCANFTRTPTGAVSDGAIVGYSNAGYLKFAGESYVIDYAVPLESIVTNFDDPGALNLTLNAFHTTRETTSASGLGFDLVRTDGTLTAPSWAWSLQDTYVNGPYQLTLTTLYKSPAKYSYTDTIEQRSPLGVSSYIQNDASIAYQVNDRVSVRLIVNNISDAQPPYGQTTIGDLVGRYYNIGLSYKY